MLMIKKIRGGKLQPPPGQHVFSVITQDRSHEPQFNQHLKQTGMIPSRRPFQGLPHDPDHLMLVIMGIEGGEGGPAATTLRGAQRLARRGARRRGVRRGAPGTLRLVRGARGAR